MNGDAGEFAKSLRERVESKLAEGRVPLQDALGLGEAGILEQIEHRRKSIVGWITPEQVQPEVDALEAELRRRREADPCAPTVEHVDLARPAAGHALIASEILSRFVATLTEVKVTAAQEGDGDA